jgi:ribokinase
VIIVFGSLNIDLIARVPRLPRPGETLAGRSFCMMPGGKGANQALGASRAGARVHLFGCVGRDAMAAIALRGLRAGGVGLSGVGESDAFTGVALIHVDDTGENSITIVAGANAEARAAQVPDVLLDASATVLMQLEVSPVEVAALARRAHRRGARVILNAAPAVAPSAGLLDDVDVLVVNEAEARTLAGGDADIDLRTCCSKLAAPHRSVVVTLGATGALYACRGEIREQPAPRIEAVDSVGAGDAFAATLAAALDRGSDFEQAVRQGVAAGSLACLRAGAQDALPTREDIVRVASGLSS